MDMNTKTFAVPAALSLHTADLVKKFAEEMAHKLYKAEQKGRGGWESNTWEGACRQALFEHIEKGDPIDVANFLAFMWHHGWPIQLDIHIISNDSDGLVAMSTAVAGQLLSIRDSLDKGHVDEAMFSLVNLADPNLSHINPWGKLEAIAGWPVANEELQP